MCDKKKKNKKKRKKTKKLSQFLKSHISGTREAISLKFGMWSTAVGGNVHSKNRLVSSRKHRATEVRKLRFLSSCQYTHGCYAPASWAARHTTVCLDFTAGIECNKRRINLQDAMGGMFTGCNGWNVYKIKKNSIKFKMRRHWSNNTKFQLA